MALSEAHAPAAAASLRLEPLTERDIDAGLALSDAAGWNQTGDDWALFIRHGHAIGLRDDAGRWVATAAALPYGGERGWISMVLVADGWRHRGLASRLMDACVDHLRTAGIVPVLDATPAGAAVYRRLGFLPGFEIDRWERRGSPASSAAPARAGAATSSAFAPRPVSAADLDVLAALDRAATGLDRRLLLDSFLARPDTRAWLAGDGRGFVVARAGRRATQVGPLAAPDDAGAIALLVTAIAEVSSEADRTIFLDVPRAHRPVAETLEDMGFARQRSFVRMSLGGTGAPRLGAGRVVLAGPEFG